MQSFGARRLSETYKIKIVKMFHLQISSFLFLESSNESLHKVPPPMLHVYSSQVLHIARTNNCENSAYLLFSRLFSETVSNERAPCAVMHWRVQRRSSSIKYEDAERVNPATRRYPTLTDILLSILSSLRHLKSTTHVPLRSS